MDKDKIRERLSFLHTQENKLNKEISAIDSQIKLLKRRKIKLAKMVSANMLYRNKLIADL